MFGDTKKVWFNIIVLTIKQREVIMTQLKLNTKNSYLTKFKEEFILKYGLLKQEVLDKSKVLATNKNLVQEIFDELNTSVVKLTKVPKIKISSNV